MNYLTRRTTQCRGTPPPTWANLQASSRRGGRQTARVQRERDLREACTGSARTVLTTTAASAVLAGPLCWELTRSLLMSLGAVLILAATGAAAAWLLAREETERVKARERGATDRERIRHRGETLLAEAQHRLLLTTTYGPNSSSADAQALRADARKVLHLIQPTSVSDAMLITRSHHSSAPPDLGSPTADT